METEVSDESTIRVMDDVLASQVAAGEVVERPASVIKELVENSIDADAKAIRTEISRGGVAMIKVTDDGKGMSRKDLAMCLRRHATSKLRDYAGLSDIRQLGFRGEALPSIASVSHLSITTRRTRDVEGSLLCSDGGIDEPIRTAGCPPGTAIVIRDLFYNTPVRRKFLKSIETESGHAEQQVKLHALAFPNIRFTFVRDGSVVFDLPATHDIRHRIAELSSYAAADELIRIRPTTAEGARVSGFLTPLSQARRNRKEQYIFLNGRAIEDKIITHAIREGYGGIPGGVFPRFYLYLDMEPALVDVNVHPAKREVRFRRPAELAAAVTEAVAATLTEHARGNSADVALHPVPTPAPPDSEPTVTPLPPPPSVPIVPSHLPSPPSPGYPTPPTSHAESPSHPLRLKSEPLQSELGLPREPSSVNSEIRSSSRTSGFRFLAVVREQYILFENAEGLVMLSVRAARERILFERLVEANKRAIPSQQLIAPAFIDLAAVDVGLVSQLQPLFIQAGFRVSRFGNKTLRIEAIPAFLPLRDVEPFISELIYSFSAGDVRTKRNRDPYELFVIRLAHQYVRKEEMYSWVHDPIRLLNDLLHCEIPYCTPRGKPTMIPFAYSEIQRKFQTQ